MPGVEHDPNAPIAPPGESLGDDEDDFPYPFSAEDLCPTCGSPDTRVSYERGVQDCSACGEEWPMQPSARTTSEDRRNREAHRAARQQAYEDAALYHQVMGDNPQTTPDRVADRPDRGEKAVTLSLYPNENGLWVWIAYIGDGEVEGSAKGAAGGFEYASDALADAMGRFPQIVVRHAEALQ